MKSYLTAILHSYSLLFFSRHRGFAALLALASLLNPTAGAAGLVAAAEAVGLARLLGFDRELTDGGAYSFNALLVGLALGTFYAPGLGFWLVVAVGAGLALLVTVALTSWLGSRALPVLSVPFLVVLWVLAPAAEQFHRLGLNEGSIYWLNDVYALGGERLVDLVQHLPEWSVPEPGAVYLRALSAVLFQDSVMGGLLVALGLLWHSRIAFSLSGLAFLGAWGFALLAGAPANTLQPYDLGVNYILAALAVGGVFLVPSGASYGVALLTVPITAVLITGLGKLLAGLGLPLFSLPFCATALLFLYCLLLRPRSGRLPLTPWQQYSPEGNLYAFRTNQQRLLHRLTFQLNLPFRGQWRVSQGYQGGLTHQGEWGAALDFMMTDADGRTFANAGQQLADYYCYNKPVLAPADGVVEALVMHIPDNLIGQNNTAQNWGNTVVLKHQNGLYTQLSHLRPNSAQVQVGQFVRSGEVVAACGNSGRSAEPHLHFQVQATPSVGSRPLAHPLAYYLLRTGTQAQLCSFTVPPEGAEISPPEPNSLLRQALKLLPGTRFEVQCPEQPTALAQQWEVLTDAYNLHYLRCQTTGATAYFEQDESMFTFTAYYGSEEAWLYQLYRAAYRVPLAQVLGQVTEDSFALDVLRRPGLRWVQDFLAPFWLFIRLEFALQQEAPDNTYNPRRQVLRSRQTLRVAGRVRQQQETELLFQDGALRQLSVHAPHQSYTLLCIPLSA